MPVVVFLFLFKQKTAYELRISDWSSDVCSSDLDRSDPAHGKLALFRLDPDTARLEALGKIPVLAGEAYGLCLYRAADALYAFLVMKDGTIGQIALDLEGTTPQGRLVRTLRLASQAEGCVADDRTGRPYVDRKSTRLHSSH